MASLVAAQLGLLGPTRRVLALYALRKTAEPLRPPVAYMAPPPAQRLSFFCRAFSTQVLRTDYSLALLERQLGQPRATFLAQPELHWSVKGLRDEHAPG